MTQLNAEQRKSDGLEFYYAGNETIPKPFIYQNTRANKYISRRYIDRHKKYQENNLNV